MRAVSRGRWFEATFGRGGSRYPGQIRLFNRRDEDSRTVARSSGDRPASRNPVWRLSSRGFFKASFEQESLCGALSWPGPVLHEGPRNSPTPRIPAYTACSVAMRGCNQHSSPHRAGGEYGKLMVRFPETFLATFLRGARGWGLAKECQASGCVACGNQRHAEA